MKYVIAAALCAIVLAGCATMQVGGTSSFVYRAVNDNCNCEEYRAHDKARHIAYRFRAYYKMRHGITTTIEIEFTNNSDDTLFLETGTATISSRNVSYQYNNKHVPLPHIVVPPSHSETVRMEGSDTSGKDDWNKIAGEQVVLTLEGIRLNDRAVTPQQVTFVPENPRLK